MPIRAGYSFPTLNHFEFTEFGGELKTLFNILMLDQGFLSSVQFYPTIAHTDDIMDKYEVAVDAVFMQLSEIIKKGDVKNALQDPVCLSDFQRLVK